jgi:hypothetical protein
MLNRTLVATLLLGSSLATTSCDPVTAVAVPVLVISATWDVQGDPDRTYTFRAVEDDSEGLTKGTFTGSENVTTAPDDYDLTGWWANGNIEFTVQRPGGNVVFTAKFHHDRPSQLTFTSAQETIVLLQP